MTILAVAVAAGIIIFARNKSNKNYVQADNKRQSSITLAKMDLTKSVSATGTIKSGVSKTVSAPVNGIKIKKVNVSVGDKVKKGDKLLVFDTDNLKEALAEAKENLAEAKEDYDDSVSSAQSRLSDALSTYSDDNNSLGKKVSDAKKALEKVKKEIKTLKKKIADKKNMELQASLKEQLAKAEESKKNLQNEYETAKTNIKNTNKQNKSNIESAEEALKTARSNGSKSIKEAGRQVQEAKDNLAECSVAAPAGGTVTSLYVEAGSIYNGGNIAQIDNMSSYKVVTSVDEYDISSISKGQKVIILTAATDEDELEGEITFVAPSTESTSEITGTNSDGSGTSGSYEVEIALKTKDDRLRIGMTARCSIILEEAEDVYAVPYDAIHENKDGANVIYVEDIEAMGDNRPGSQQDASTQDNKEQGSLEQREIEVKKGMESDYYVEISGEGLSEGLRVIIPVDGDISSGSTEDQSGKEGIEIPGMGGSMPEGMPSGGMEGNRHGMGGSFGGRGTGSGN